MKIVLLSDVHGDWSAANKGITLAKQLGCNCVSLGDLGDEFTYDMTMGNNDNFYLVAGNHEEYPILPRYVPYYLGDYGVLPFAENVFYFRGASSIDWKRRVPGLSWYAEEEVGFLQSEYALELYEKTKPDVVLSHDCPYYMSHKLHGNTIESHTGRVLTEMFKIHQPSRWFHGHHHEQFVWNYNPTKFYSLDIGGIEVIEV